MRFSFVLLAIIQASFQEESVAGTQISFKEDASPSSLTEWTGVVDELSTVTRPISSEMEAAHTSALSFLKKASTKEQALRLVTVAVLMASVLTALDAGSAGSFSVHLGKFVAALPAVKTVLKGMIPWNVRLVLNEAKSFALFNWVRYTVIPEFLKGEGAKSLFVKGVDGKRISYRSAVNMTFFCAFASTFLTAFRLPGQCSAGGVANTGLYFLTMVTYDLLLNKMQGTKDLVESVDTRYNSAAVEELEE
jgi:hypothetical protein